MSKRIWFEQARLPVALAAIAFLAAPATGAVAQPGGMDYRASVGCKDAKVDIIDDMTLAQYEQYVRDRRCKCLNVCEGSIVPTVDTRPQTPPPVVIPPTPVVIPQLTRKFKPYEGFDLHGGEYDIKKDVSQAVCIKACSDNNKCVAFSWDKWNRVCFLKDRVPGSLRIDPQSVSLVLASASQPRISPAPVKIWPFRSAEFRDKGYSEIRNSSFDRCEELCDDQDKCEAFSYVKGPRLCKLISKPDEYFRLRDNSVDSGVKRQAAP